MNNSKKMSSAENKSQLTYSYRRPIMDYTRRHTADRPEAHSSGRIPQYIGVTTTTRPKALYSYTLTTKDYFDNHPRRFAGERQGRRITRTIGVTSTTRPTITPPST